MEMNHSIVLKLKIVSNFSQVIEIARRSPIENRAIIGLYVVLCFGGLGFPKYSSKSSKPPIRVSSMNI